MNIVHLHIEHCDDWAVLFQDRKVMASGHRLEADDVLGVVIKATQNGDTRILVSEVSHEVDGDLPLEVEMYMCSVPNAQHTKVIPFAEYKQKALEHPHFWHCETKYHDDEE